MTYFESQQQNPAHYSQFNPFAAFGAQTGQPYGAWFGTPLMQAIGGQAAYGQPYGQQFGGGFGYGAGWGTQPQAWGQQPLWGGLQQRQLSQQDVSEVVRQLVPALPQILAQAQQPHAAIGYAAFGQAPRLLSQQDVNEVVRQILPIVPQIVGMLQGQPQLQPQLQYAALQG